MRGHTRVVKLLATSWAIAACFPPPHLKEDADSAASVDIDDTADGTTEREDPKTELAEAGTELGLVAPDETATDTEPATEAELRVDGECSVHADCDDHDACTGTEICNAARQCESIAPVVCDPQQSACFDNRCNPGSGACELVPLSDVGCDDQDPCTESDTCDAGSCRGAPVVCATNNPCQEQDGACEAATGLCGFGNKPDGRACATSAILSGRCRAGDCQPLVLMSAKNDHTCVSRGGRVYCWGRGGDGRLGYGNIRDVGDDETPADAGAVDIPGVVISLCAGASHSCALNASGQLWCWGSGASGELGRGGAVPLGDQQTPGSVAPIDTSPYQFEHVECGTGVTCAISSSSYVVCWGGGSAGKLGIGSTANIGDDELISATAYTLQGASEVASGFSHSCALRAGEIFCWGSNASGELGRGDTQRIGDDERASVGAIAVALGGVATRVSVGYYHSCATLSTGQLRCWGSNATNQLGVGSTNVGDNEAVSSTPTLTLPGTVDRVAAGVFHTCALVGGGVYCWGNGSHGQLGAPGTEFQPYAASATKVDLGGTAVEIVAGQQHTCAILEDASVVCWGANEFGQLGVGNEVERGLEPGTMPPLRVQFE